MWTVGFRLQKGGFTRMCVCVQKNEFGRSFVKKPKKEVSPLVFVLHE